MRLQKPAAGRSHLCSEHQATAPTVPEDSQPAAEISNSISTETENESDALNAFVGVSPTIWVLFKSNGTARIDLVHFKMHILGSIKTIFSVISRKKIILNIREAFIVCTRSITSSPYNVRLKALINLCHLLEFSVAYWLRFWAFTSVAQV